MRFARWIVAALLVLIIVIGGLCWFADTQTGHRWIAARIETYAPDSGLRIKIKAIEGSIYGRPEVLGVILSDPQGPFLTVDRVTLDWVPRDWLSNKLSIKSLVTERAALLRLPHLRAGKQGSPSLPSFDIQVDHFDVSPIRIAKGIAGPERLGSARGHATVAQGKAALALDFDAQEGDRLTLQLSAEPDKNLFDADAQIQAPAGGFIAALAGTKFPLALNLTGTGNWAAWQGRLDARVNGKSFSALSVTARDGQFGVKGQINVAPYLSGKAFHLVGPTVTVNADAQFEDRQLKGSFQANSAALSATGAGSLDFATNAFRGATVDLHLLKPAALFSNMHSRDMRLQARLNGPFSTARFDYLLTAPHVSFDQTGIENLRASGQGRLSGFPQTLPAKILASRITGVGDVAGGILANITVEGPLRLTTKTITSDVLRLHSDKLNGMLSLVIDLTSGKYTIGLNGTMHRYLIPGLGLVDLVSELKAVPDTSGKGPRVAGHGRAWVRRLDNRFLLDLAGGLPVLDTMLERGQDGVLYLRNFRLTAPGVTLTGNGIRRTDGTFLITASGSQAQYGPLTMTLDGPIEKPRIALALVRPNAALGLATVKLNLVPTGKGFNWVANGGSRAGPFTGLGAVVLAPNGQTAIHFEELNLSGMRATGTLRPVKGGFDGEMGLQGQGVSGILEFSPTAQGQRIRANLEARDAQLSGPPLMKASRMQVDGDLIIDPRGTTIDATVTGEGLQYGGFSLARLAGNVKLTNGIGEIRASLSGDRGRAFDIQTVAQVAPREISIIGQGTIERRPVSLASRAVLTRERDGWRLAPTLVDFAGGSAKIGGLFSPTASELVGTLDKMPLAILDLLDPTLGLGGVADGSFSFRQPTSGQPTGRTELKIRGLSRAGLVLASNPVDVAVAALLGDGKAGARIVATSGGATIGRAQVQLSSIAGQGPLIDRLLDAPLFAQLRYSGEADTLWRLTGIENFDLAGTVNIGADMGGKLRTPDIRGSVRTSNARIESTASGMVLTEVEANGKFDGSRLLIENLSAKAGKDGRVSGQGQIEFAGAASGINLTLNAVRAPLIARDDIAATVTGPIRIKSDGEVGEIGGEVVLDRSSFRLGQVNIAQVSRLNTHERAPRADAPPARAKGKPWRLAFTARAPSRLIVTGLGIDSEWQADLRIGGTIENPSIRGIATLVHGDYDFAGKRFALERGTIRFDGSVPADPNLDIVAVGDAKGVAATIHVAGTGQRPEISFTSVPALPQDELLSRLLFGTSITNLSAPEAVQLAAAVSALRDGGTGLNPINELRRAVGLDRLRILPADSATGQGTSIAAGKYVTRRTYVEIVTDGKGYSATSAEFQITRWLSLLSTISTIGTQSVKIRISKDY
jgi:translocation and assembly module TamB